jgi:predicted nucleic acid-binding protein
LSRVFVDTSAFFALLSATDTHHQDAVRVFSRLRAQQSMLLTTSFALVETYALIGKRLGREAVTTFRSDFTPLLEVSWVDGELHERGLDLMLERPVGVSLVDAVSFVCIRQQRIDEVFAFDRHFEQEGFALAV